MAKQYQYQGKAGSGVPGLPHAISDQEAKEAGLEALLKECVEAGLYKEVKPRADAKTEAKASQKESE